MNEIVTSNYAIIDGITIKLSNDKIKCNGNDTVLKDVTLEIIGTRLIIKGSLVLWGFTFDTLYVENMTDKPDPSSITTDYKNWRDRIKGIKTECVFGWYRLLRTTEYRAYLSNFIIIYPEK